MYSNIGLYMDYVCVLMCSTVNHCQLDTLKYLCICRPTSLYICIRQHTALYTSVYISIQHCTPLYMSTYSIVYICICQHTALQRWSNRTRVLVLVLEYSYFLSTSTRVRRKVIVLEYITKVIVLTITFHDYIFFIWTIASIRQIK